MQAIKKAHVAKQELSITVVNNDTKSVINTDLLSKLAIKSGDKLKINKIVDKQEHEIDNFIVTKNGNDLNIHFHDGQMLSIKDFYSFENVEIEFSAPDSTRYTLSSESSFGSELADGSSLVYTQGDQNLLLRIANDDPNLQAALNEQFMLMNTQRFAELETAAGATEAEAGIGWSTAAIVGLGAVIVGGVVVASNNSSSGTVLGSNGLIGQFIDSAVAGVDYYINGVLAGQTGADGSFNYEAGDTITFKVGDITIGEIAAADINADGKVLPQDLAGVARTDTTDPTVVKIAQFLQTLDSDGDAANGITIDATSLAKVDGSGVVDLTTANLFDAIDDDVESTIVSADDAILHLNDTTNSLDSTFVAATTLTGTISEIMQDITLGDGTDVEVTDTTLSIEQLMAIKEIIGDGVLTYPNMTTITGAAAVLAADTTYISAGMNVTVTDAATIAQLTTIDSLTTGTLTYTEMTDTAANLIANTGGYLTGAINTTVIGTATIAELTTIDGLTTGTLIYEAIEDDVAVLAADTLGYVAALNGVVGAEVSFSLSEETAASMDQIAAIDALTDATLFYRFVNDTAERVLLNEGGGYIRGGVTVYVETATVAQLRAIDELVSDGVEPDLSGVDYGSITDTAANIIAEIGGTYLLPDSGIPSDVYDVPIFVTDEITADQLATIDAVTTGVVTATIAAGTLSTYYYDDTTMTYTVGTVGELSPLVETDIGNALDITVSLIPDLDLSIGEILAINERTTVQIDASLIDNWAGSAEEVLALQAAKDAGEITYIDTSWYSIVGTITNAQLIDVADHADNNLLGIWEYVLDSGDSLDLGYFATQEVAEVWEINSVTDTAANAITISLADLQTLSDQTDPLGLNGNIYITSGAEDSVTFDDISGWSVTQDVTLDFGTKVNGVYDQYTQGDYTVYIQDGTTVA